MFRVQTISVLLSICTAWIVLLPMNPQVSLFADTSSQSNGHPHWALPLQVVLAGSTHITRLLQKLYKSKSELLFITTTRIFSYSNRFLLSNHRYRLWSFGEAVRRDMCGGTIIGGNVVASPIFFVNIHRFPPFLLPTSLLPLLPSSSSSSSSPVYTSEWNMRWRRKSQYFLCHLKFHLVAATLFFPAYI